MQNGDHILQINDVNLRGMGSDQVAQVLRQAGTNVRLIVARPVDPSDDFSNLQCNAPIVPTRSLLDPEEIEKCLVLHQQQVIALSIWLKLIKNDLNLATAWINWKRYYN